ncbi:MAG TPA: hypothetical protein VN519_06940 [Bryobacteraceae bacterium]|nr:hypothetical protein [Bryobacteraceae bacterium]
MSDQQNILGAIAAMDNRDYITPEDVNIALKDNPADIVRLHTLHVLGKQAGIGAEDPGLCAFVAWVGVYEPEVDEEETGSNDD